MTTLQIFFQATSILYKDSEQAVIFTKGLPRVFFFPIGQAIFDVLYNVA
jgi:hypothetical protein